MQQAAIDTMPRESDAARVFAILALVGLYLVWPLYQILDYVAAQPFADVADVVNYAASIAAYNWMLLNVLLGVKIPVLQRWLPYDLRIRAHIVSTVLVTVFVAWHGVYYLFWNPKEISVVTWSLLGTFAALLAASLLWIPLPGFRWLARLTQGRGRAYDALKDVHKVAFLVVAGLTYWHIIETKLLGISSPLSAWGFQILGLVTVAAFLLVRLHNRLLPVLSVASVTTTGSLVQLRLEGSRHLRYRAGQFAFLRFQHPDLQGEEHPFSFTSAPHEPTVEFAIKAVGDFTRRLAVLQPGDQVRVNGGFGAFRPRHDRRPLVLLGTGIGAAPLVSLLKDRLRHPQPGELHVVVAARSRDDLIDPLFWETLPARLPGAHVHVLLSERGDPLLSAAWLHEHVPQAAEAQYLLCSSDRVRAALLEALDDVGVPRRLVRYEAFQLG